MKGYVSWGPKEIRGILHCVRHCRLPGRDIDIYELTINVPQCSDNPPARGFYRLFMNYFGSLDTDSVKPGTEIRLQERSVNGQIHQHLIAKNYLASGYPVPEEYREKSFEQICKALPQEATPPAPA